ncbi:TetR/AcrR family transcriptional regulator [Kribbella jiaozuonensis]|uniref:TetR/AcrR family transcriptional regulator n=1 Tax=Kribbella jiaozuonensis TaxID=2575441 RepID=A0A4U3M288_9ACTN|nr:TetR/AcrR family transcriptional regulator [Kribbella jiaozuonensis]TKK81924.1 TetR/AcrR family transcriptional regulator [Kribbella jiaozuonensis]
MDERLGLRERKKRESRRRIADVASGLFIERGFDNVTIAEVAEAANVARMTVFNYFPRKEDLFLDRQADLVDDLSRAIREREPGESVVGAVRRYLHELLAAQHPLSGARDGTEGFYQIVDASPALVRRTLEHTRELADSLKALLESEVGPGLQAEVVANLIATAVTIVPRVAVDKLIAGRPGKQVRREQVDVIDQTFDLLEGGIGQYGR